MTRVTRLRTWAGLPTKLPAKDRGPAAAYRIACPSCGTKHKPWTRGSTCPVCGARIGAAKEARS